MGLAEEGGDVLDRTTGVPANGKEIEDTGVDHYHVTINGYYDIATGNTSGIRRGAIVTDLALFRASTDATPAYAIIECSLVVRGAPRTRQCGPRPDGMDRRSPQPAAAMWWATFSDAG